MYIASPKKVFRGVTMLIRSDVESPVPHKNTLKKLQDSNVEKASPSRDACSAVLCALHS